MSTKARNILRKSLKALVWIVGSVIALLVAIALLIQIPAIQLKLTRKAIAFLEEKIGTEVALRGIKLTFPKNVVLEGIYLEDQEGDTLLYAERLAIDTDLWALASHEIQLNEIALEQTVAIVNRPPQDSAFNFTYILEAFAGDSTAVPDTLEQKGWGFSLGRLLLDEIRVRFDDRLLGNHASISLGTFGLEMETFDLDENRYAVGEVRLADTRARFTQTKIPSPSEKTEDAADSAAALVVSLNRLAVENVRLSYEQVPLGQEMRATIGEFEVLPQEIDLANQTIAINEVSLSQSMVAYRQSRSESVPALDTAKVNQPGTTEPWNVSIGNLQMAGNTLRYLNLTQPQLENALDFNNLRITGLDMKVRDVIYAPGNIGAGIEGLSFREQSGLVLKTLTAQIDIAENQAHVSDFLLETGHSRLRLTAEASYPSLANIGETYASADLAAEVDESHISLRDIALLQPALLDSLPLSVPEDASITLDAAIAGAINDMDIRHLVFGMLSETTLRASGNVAGLASAAPLRFDLALDKFHTTRADVQTLLPDTLLPDSIQLPAWLDLQAKYQGSLEEAEFNAAVTSADGGIDLKGTMNLDSTSALRGVHATLSVNDLDVGDILGKPDSVMDVLSMRATVESNGLTPEEMAATLTGAIHRFDFRDYRYDSLELTASLRNRILTAHAGMDDNNLRFTLDAGYHFNDDVPLYEVDLDIKNADFRALNLSKDHIRGRGNLMVEMETADFRILNGNVGIRKVAIYNGDELYTIDSLLFASIDQEGRSQINIDSDILTANFEGSINIFALGETVTEYINTYYSLHDSLEIRDAEPQFFSFDIDLKNTEILTGLLVPNLTEFVPGKIAGKFNSRERLLDFTMEIEDMQYGNIGIDSLVFTTDSDEQALVYHLDVDRVMIDSMELDGLALNGAVANDSMHTELIILDSTNTQKYVLAGTFVSEENAFGLRLSPDAILLNYQPWSVPENNFMRFGGGKFIARNVVLRNLRERIIIESSGEAGTPVMIGFRELNLEYLSSMIAQRRPLSGLLQGDVHLYTDSAMTFTADLTIDDFRIQDALWGDVTLDVGQSAANRFDINFGLTGERNQVTAAGFYQGGQSPSMDLSADIDRFSLASLQPLVARQFEDLQGLITGRLHVGGTPATPDIDGRLLFRETNFFSTYLQTSFSIDEETIAFIEEGISFNAFEIADENGNKARLNGAILTSDYRDFRFNLDLFTDRFRLFDTEKGDNDLFYGEVGIEANARIRGDTDTPVITMNIGLTPGSRLTYVVPQSEAAILQSDGIVTFVDKTFEDDPFVRQVQPEASDTIKSTFRGLDLTARIELSDEETLSVVIDPLTGDQLTIRGNSTLTLKIDPTGDIHLVGRYEISEGTYNLSFYKFVKREFRIEPGSSLTWTGDPLNAQMDITAIYRVETAPIDLFANQLTGADAGQVNRFRQRLPFLVFLNIDGELLEPEISFELGMPMDQRNFMGGNVYARIQDINTRESELNKQVFALLILKRFIADDPFESQAGGGLASTARRSVSKILSEQLNRLSENIKGVELSFDIKSYEDYSTGEAEGKTELQLGFSKSFLDDRLIVKLSGSVDIEGGEADHEATDYIGDLALEYKLTPDGRFRITGFRNSNYDMIDGELTETGVGLIYVKDYNTLSELFKANAETRN